MHELSDYELLREAKINRNNIKLKELGLLKDRGGKSLSKSKRKRAVTPSIKKNGSVSYTNLPVRRSTRLSRIEDVRKHEVQKECDDGDLKFPIEESKTNSALAGIRNGIHSSSSVRKQRRVEIPLVIDQKDVALLRDTGGTFFSLSSSSAKCKSRETRINVQSIVSQCLGKYLTPKTGKASVVTTASNNPHISFNKYSGVLEWENCLFLWVNLGGVNTFVEKGRKVIITEFHIC